MSRLPDMSISVAMCTCNGEPHLAEQLACIAAQDRLPDELVVHDDASTDGTVEIVERFAKSAPMPVRLTVNTTRLGVANNFSQAIADCRGRLIFTADQDDLWRPLKINRLGRLFDERPDVGLAFSNAELIDDEGHSLNCDLWRAVGFTRAERQAINDGHELRALLRHNVVTGATMGFRAELRDLVLPVDEGWIHDGWIALLAASVARLAAIDEPLTAYRQHANQQIGERRRSLFEDYQRIRRRGIDDFSRTVNNYAAAAERLAQHAERLRNDKILDTIRGKAEHFRAKAAMRHPSTRRLPLIVSEIRRRHYRDYSLGWKSILQDLFL